MVCIGNIDVEVDVDGKAGKGLIQYSSGHVVDDHSEHVAGNKTVDYSGKSFHYI